MLSRSRSVTGPRFSPSGARLAWVDAYDGRADVVVAPSDGAGPPVVVTAECGAGNGFAWADDDTLVVAAADGRLVVVHADGGVERVLTREGRAATPAVSVLGEVACTIERDDACDIATVPLDGTAWPERVSHADFARDPEWSPDGRALVWQEWDLPNMPWHAARIMRRDGAGDPPYGVDGAGVGGGACSQPRFSPDGARLAWMRDGDLVVDGELLPGQSQQECAEPGWADGQHSFAWSPDGSELTWCRNESGFGRLVVGAPGRKSARELSRGWHRDLSWGEGGILCMRSGAVTPAQIVVLAANGSGRRAIARGPVAGFERTGLIEPRPVMWKSASAAVHGMLWRPADTRGPLPMVVHVHGGPTGQALADWNPRVQWLVQQGYAVLQPNHRGSSGYGVAYRNALDGRWGDLDVADVVSGIKHAVKEGWAVPGRVALMGASAGGFTALNVAVNHSDLVAAVVALYPVVDLLDLAATTHRFESGDLARLVGPLPAARDEYLDRSPVTHAGAVRAPVLLLQGDEDGVVNPERTAAFADALRGAGVTVESHVYAGEGHGWRRAATVADELARLDAFLSRWC